MSRTRTGEEGGGCFPLDGMTTERLHQLACRHCAPGGLRVEVADSYASVLVCGRSGTLSRALADIERLETPVRDVSAFCNRPQCLSCSVIPFAFYKAATSGPCLPVGGMPRPYASESAYYTALVCKYRQQRRAAEG